jgi:hypothetical protein
MRRNSKARKDLKGFNLATLLAGVVREGDKGDYGARNQMIYAALACAALDGADCGVRFNQDDHEWPIVYIVLPTGQVSWTVQQFLPPASPHTIDENNAAIQKFVERYL